MMLAERKRTTQGRKSSTITMTPDGLPIDGRYDTTSVKFEERERSHDLSTTLGRMKIICIVLKISILLRALPRGKGNEDAGKYPECRLFLAQSTIPNGKAFRIRNACHFFIAAFIFYLMNLDTFSFIFNFWYTHSWPWNFHRY